MANETEQKAITTIREEFARRGFPINVLTDKQIEEGVRRFAKAVSKFGITAEQARKVLPSK